MLPYEQVQALVARLDKAETLITDCMNQFQFYAANHRQQAFNETNIERRCDKDQKAQVNESFVKRCKDFLEE